MIKREDNTSLALKVNLRRNLIGLLPSDLFILETHGGEGKVWEQLYSGHPTGGVIEKDPDKASFLARQRPSWQVYESKAEVVLEAGLFRKHPVGLLDVDPYGEPWPVIEAFFGRSDRVWPPLMGIAVNDGLRQNTRIKGSWKIASLKEMVRKYGNDNIRKHYKEICREKVTEIAGRAGYSVDWWRAYYCGNLNDMTHYAAVLVKE